MRRRPGGPSSSDDERTPTGVRAETLSFAQHDHHRRKWVYRRFEGLIWHLPEVYCRFEGLLKDETPSIGVEISTLVLGVFAYISPSKRK